MNKILSLLLVLFFFTAPCFAVTMEFLDIPMGARPVALGGAVSAFPGAIDSVYLNPACLGTIRSTQIEFSYALWLDTFQYGSLAYAQCLKTGALALDIFGLQTGAFDETDLNGLNGHVLEYGDFSATIGYGMSIKDLSLGANLKLASSYLSGSRGISVAIGIGALYRIKMSFLNDVRLALIFNNLSLGTKFERTWESIPTNMTFGLYTRLFDTGKQRIDLTADFIQPFSSGINQTFTPGIEYCLFNVFSIRAGYKFGSDLNHLSLGVGLDGNKLSFSYALAFFGELGLIHTVSVNINISRIGY